MANRLNTALTGHMAVALREQVGELPRQKQQRGGKLC